MRQQESEARTTPNASLIQAQRNALTVGLVFGLVGGLAFGLLNGLVSGLVIWLSIGLPFGLVFGLNYGGKVAIQHWGLRFVLREQLPLQLVPFLEAMGQRWLVQRVGGGYRFVHRTVQEHIAGLSRGDILELAGRIDQQTQ